MSSLSLNMLTFCHVLLFLHVSSTGFSISSRCSFLSHRFSRFGVCFLCSNFFLTFFSTLLLPFVVVAKLGSLITHHTTAFFSADAVLLFLLTEGIPHNPSAPEKSAGPGTYEGTSWDEIDGAGTNTEE